MSMDHQSRIDAALLSFWLEREAQSARQEATGQRDAGTRGSVTGGAHLNAIAGLLGELCISAGAPPHSVATSGEADLRVPGYFRPSKKWDLVVWRNATPIVLIELKSQVGSFGNNANNRAEEALGNAHDVRAAHRHGLLPRVPWMGFVYIMEDCAQSRREGRVANEGRLPRDPTFEGASYLDRVKHLCHRLQHLGLYNATWPVATTPPPHFGWTDLDPGFADSSRFVEALQEAVSDAFPQ